VIPLAEKLIEEFPLVVHYRAGLAETYLYRGELLLSLDQTDLTTAELTKSLAVSRELLDRHGVLTKSLLIRGNTFLALARARSAWGALDEAAAHWKNAAKVFEIALKLDPVAIPLTNSSGRLVVRGSWSDTVVPSMPNEIHRSSKMLNWSSLALEGLGTDFNQFLGMPPGVIADFENSSKRATGATQSSTMNLPFTLAAQTKCCPWSFR
jgi:tetratricopeptide (TPR) repeat protein